MDPFTKKLYDPPSPLIDVGNHSFHLPSLYEWMFNRGYTVNPMTGVNFTDEEREKVFQKARDEFPLYIVTESCLRETSLIKKTSLMDPQSLLSYFVWRDSQNYTATITLDEQNLHVLVDECPTILLKDLGFTNTVRVNISKLPLGFIGLLRLRRIYTKAHMPITRKLDLMITKEWDYHARVTDDLQYAWKRLNIKGIGYARCAAILRLDEWIYVVSITTLYDIPHTNPVFIVNGKRVDSDTLISSLDENSEVSLKYYEECPHNE